MNLLYDHRPQQLLSNVGLFLDQLKDLTSIDLFLSSLKLVVPLDVVIHRVLTMKQGGERYPDDV